MKRFLILLLFIVYACRPSFVPVKSHSDLKTLGTEYYLESDSSVLLKYQPYKMQLEDEMNKVISFSTMEMEKGLPESTLGNFFSDALLHYVSLYSDSIAINPPEFAVFNNGGLRASLPKGEITVRNIFELMPFENELVILQVDSSFIFPLINYITSKGGVPVAGMKLTIEGTHITDFRIKGQAFDSTKTYRLLTSSYLANGGDQFYFFNSVLLRESTGIKIRDALIHYLQLQKQSGKNISSNLDQRIEYEP